MIWKTMHTTVDDSLFLGSSKPVISRTSPNSLYKAIKAMTEEQKTLIERIGFGEILKIGFSDLPNRLLCHVVNEYTSGKIEITKENIHGMLGVPNRGETIVTGERCKKTDPEVISWNKSVKVGIKSSKVYSEKETLILFC